MVFPPHPREATEEAGTKCFAYGCLGAGQPSLLSLQQLPVTAELRRASRALLVATAPEGKCREPKAGPTSSFCVSEVQERSLLGFLL